MALQVPICGEARLLNMLLNTGSVNEHPFLRLYSNSMDAGQGIHITSLTAVPETGYSAAGAFSKPMSGGSWVITSGNPTQAAFAEQTYTFTASFGNVHGYYVVHSQANILLWSEKFTGGPYNIVNSGDAIKVTPILTLQ